MLTVFRFFSIFGDRKGEERNRMNQLKDEQIRTAGEIRRRAEFSQSRLHTDPYACKNFIQHSEYSWPGDFEGRTLLAKVSLARTLGTSEDFGDELNAIAENANADGYFGAVFDGATMNEQQLSGNSWLMRGLCESYLLNGNRTAEELLRRMTESWLLRLQPFYQKYPIQNEARADGTKGEAIGALYANAVNGWKLSTDTGCAFIALDGITQVAQVLGEKRLYPLIETMIARFLQIDKVGLRCQTHATLSATRGILRYYELTGRREYLAAATEIYALYREHGMTLNYANYNWFERPEWTEPCAVVDALTIAFSLFRFTEDFRYAEDANRIFWNALKFAQRSNGGFGCDTCLTLENGTLSATNTYEAYWCCTMRGAEGIRVAAQNQYLEEESTVFVPGFNDGEAVLMGGRLVLRQSTEMPYHGKVVFQILKNEAGRVTIRLYRPQNVFLTCVSGAEAEVLEHEIRIRTEGCGEISLEFEILPCVREEKGKKLFWAGDLLLGKLEGAPEYTPERVYSLDGHQLVPVADMKGIPEETARKVRQKFVFAS